jgi:5-methylcytosine-specific restriction endonuclease McrA
MGTELADRLDTALGDLLDLDPDTLTDSDLHELVVTVQRHSHRLAALRAKLISVWDGRKVWADDGSRTAAHRLSREASMAVGSAKVEVCRARRLRSMPHTAAALASGALSPDHVDLLARASHGARSAQFVDHEATLVEQCQLLRFGEACRMVDYWRQCADAEGTEDEAARLHAGRHASVAKTLDGVVDVRALLDPVGGAAFKAELDRLERQLYLDDKKSGTVRTVGQRRADALVEMAHRSRTSAPGGLRPRPLITVLVGETSFAHMCELAAGTVVAPGQVVPLLSEADIERVVFDGPDRVMAVSRRRRFTGALRRAIEVRDRHCQHPSGCDEPADNCDVDHKQPYADGGETSQENAEIECRPHNRDKTKHTKKPRRDPPEPRPPPTD